MIRTVQMKKKSETYATIPRKDSIVPNFDKTKRTTLSTIALQIG